VDVVFRWEKIHANTGVTYLYGKGEPKFPEKAQKQTINHGDLLQRGHTEHSQNRNDSDECGRSLTQPREKLRRVAN
jgi:hypothetical protein